MRADACLIFCARAGLVRLVCTGGRGVAGFVVGFIVSLLSAVLLGGYFYARLSSAAEPVAGEAEAAFSSASIS